LYFLWHRYCKWGVWGKVLRKVLCMLCASQSVSTSWYFLSTTSSYKSHCSEIQHWLALGQYLQRDKLVVPKSGQK
jgi:hypothetical protein